MNTAWFNVPYMCIANENVSTQYHQQFVDLSFFRTRWEKQCDGDAQAVPVLVPGSRAALGGDECSRRRTLCDTYRRNDWWELDLGHVLLTSQHAPCLWRSEYFIILLNQRVIGQTGQGTLESWKGKVDRSCWRIGRTMEID